MIPVTDEMVAAARRQIPERWGLQNLRDAIVAALDAAPKLEELVFDSTALPPEIAAEFERVWNDVKSTGQYPDVPRVRFAPPITFGDGTPEVFVAADGLEGSGVQDATGSLTTIPVHYPQPNEALAAPLVLGGITEIASRLEAARSTVVGWIKRAEKIGMPAPIATLAAGPVFDLNAVEAWYRAWKAGDADGEADT